MSILVLTLNEERNLPACLASVKWSDDVVVFDSFSTDRTVEVAKEYGARVIQRKFDNYASQRNAALSEVKYRYPWLLMVDADERVPPELRDEILRTVSNASDSMSMFRMRRKDFFCGRWLKRTSGYPTWFGRLVRVGCVTVRRDINEEYHTDGEVRFLQEHLIHYPFNKGLTHWYQRHNGYSSMEAIAYLEEISRPFEIRGLISLDPVRRRRTVKQLAFRLPARPLFVFMYLWLFRFGFMDGRPGLTFVVLRAVYEHMIDLKVRELRRRAMDLPV
ncbi:MAG: glycosyltransferase family 2 protein [Nitrososphaera sp.]|nr:glycosyltransferase family 2 protein [Nitrososphaera sp.]